MLALGYLDAAWLTLLNFVFYCCPSELLRVRCRDLVAPPRGGSAALRKWGVLLSPIEGGAPSKTAVFEESLLRDNAEFLWVSQVLEAITARGSPEDFVVGFTYPQWCGHFQQAVNALPIDALRPISLYHLGHGGAGREILGGGGDIEGVKKRGRWQSDSPFHQHVKAGRFNEQLQRLDDRAQEAAARRADRLSSMILVPSRACSLLREVDLDWSSLLGRPGGQPHGDLRLVYADGGLDSAQVVPLDCPTARCPGSRRPAS
ncbi:unnamed protein product [Prorocentrum cordatum]|uniref:Uncharacterized protein n=1 Tax=Prorocentrum cordatum TaxID=2364126 RepID=A0ABN9U982_9DINO|nr:unnamed protein product [Polarella glacialis]